MLKHVFYSIGLPLFSTRWVQSRVFIKLPLVTPKALCGVDQSQKYSAYFFGRDNFSGKKFGSTENQTWGWEECWAITLLAMWPKGKHV